MLCSHDLRRQAQEAERPGVVSRGRPATVADGVAWTRSSWPCTNDARVAAPVVSRSDYSPVPKAANTPRPKCEPYPSVIGPTTGSSNLSSTANPMSTGGGFAGGRRTRTAWRNSRVSSSHFSPSTAAARNQGFCAPPAPARRRTGWCDLICHICGTSYWH